MMPMTTVNTAVMKMGNNMEWLFLHQSKDKAFEEIIHKK